MADLAPWQPVPLAADVSDRAGRLLGIADISDRVARALGIVTPGLAAAASASGSVAAPGALTAIASLAGLAAGDYDVVFGGLRSGVDDAAAFNFQLRTTGAGVTFNFPSPVGGPGFVGRVVRWGAVDAGGSIMVRNQAAGGVGSVYNAFLIAMRVA